MVQTDNIHSKFLSFVMNFPLCPRRPQIVNPVYGNFQVWSKISLPYISENMNGTRFDFTYLLYKK